MRAWLLLPLSLANCVTWDRQRSSPGPTELGASQVPLRLFLALSILFFKD